MNFGRFCESGLWMAKVAMNRIIEEMGDACGPPHARV